MRATLSLKNLPDALMVRLPERAERHQQLLQDRLLAAWIATRPNVMF
jgi:hypothetical protein